MKEFYGVGLMSGTSLDGIDAALVKIKEQDFINLELLEFINLPMDKALRNEIETVINNDASSTKLVCELNFRLGYIFSEAVKKVCEKKGFPMEKLDFIGSHGQTVYHIPEETNGDFKSTLQIGEPAVIAYETNTMVVSNFRTMDVAAGGYGAPLVPFTEYLLYKNDKNRALQNIGGIGNVTIIPSSGDIDKVFAFDTGPGNMMIDEVTKLLKDLPYDKNGEIASKGKVIEPIISYLMNHEYISKVPPKTTGREMFGEQFSKEIVNRFKEYKSEDIIATVTYFTAKTIAYNYRKFIFPKVKIDEVIIGGGGSYNSTLVKMIKDELKECKVMIQEELGYSSDAKEAIAFALLAYSTLRGIPSNVIGATGARENVLLGNITLPPRNLKYKGGLL